MDDKRQNDLKMLRDQVKALAKPIDFEKLETLGILTKVGAWYRIHKMKELPKHASDKIYEIAQDSRGTKVKFRKPLNASKTSKLLAGFAD